MISFLKRSRKYIFLSVIVFSLFILQTIPGFLEFYGIRPLLLLPACICIAIYEGAYLGGLFGFIGGILCDSVSENVFGFNAALYLVICVAAGLVMENLFRRSYINNSVISLVGVFLRCLVEYYFDYRLYSYEGLSKFFYVDMMPQVVYSGIVILVFCAFAGRIHGFIDPGSVRE